VIEEIDGVRYINTGDWVESCTAIAEHEDGRFELITWRNMVGTAEEPEPATAVKAISYRAA